MDPRATLTIELVKCLCEMDSSNEEIAETASDLAEATFALLSQKGWIKPGEPGFTYPPPPRALAPPPPPPARTWRSDMPFNLDDEIPF